MDNLEEHNESMNEVVSLSDDRISQLPQNLIHHILILLPIKDAAKTALMTTQWRRHWRSIPQLVFDAGFARITEPGATNKLILKIYKSLLVHDGSVSEFVLAVPGLTPCDEIDYIIHNLSGRGVKKFTLRFSGGQGQAYKLPSSLFTALQLNHLELERCLFMAPPWFVGFSKLSFLDLREVSLPPDFFDNFLPKCPLLENLTLLQCKGLAELELDAPRLKQFVFSGHLLKISFKHTPLLSILLLYVNGLQKLDLVDFFTSLPALQQLFIRSKLIEVIGKGGHIPSRLSKPLRWLQILHVFVSHNMMVQILVCLIMSSPNLHTLTIKHDVRLLNQPADNLVTGIGSLLEAEHRNGSCLQHLKLFTIEDSLGTPFELELVRFILATAPQLLRIRVKPSPRLCSRKVIKFTKKVLQYKRISEAEVIYDWNDDDDEED